MIGNLKLLLKQGKTPVVVSQNPVFLKKFCSQFIDVHQVEFICELPRGIRSFWSWLKNGHYASFSEYYRCDTIILGGGEILTEENPNAYRYWFWSMWALFFFFKIQFIIMGGVQIPKSAFNLFLFRYMLKRVDTLYLRDFDAIAALEEFGCKKATFLMDTSYFVVEDWENVSAQAKENKAKKEKSNSYLVLNLNSNAERFFDEMVPLIKGYQEKGWKIYYVPISKGHDDDARYYQWFVDAGICPERMVLLDWEENFGSFLQVLAGADKVIGTRLHLFLVSSFLGCDVQVFPYQKKILKMQKVLRKFGF